MPTLESDRLVFRFPRIEKDAQFSIDFQRTLRIPDTDRTYSLPPGLGMFPLRHVEDHAGRLDSATLSRGGVIMPIWQAEAMWLNFDSKPYGGPSFPVAIKVAAGKINALTGEAWRPGLNRHPQDYMVSPRQPWLDGFAVAPGVIRQFVAMPLGGGYTVEQQISGKEEWGGLQIQVVPLKNQVWRARRKAWDEEKCKPHFAESVFRLAKRRNSISMGLGAGGLMKQAIYPDKFKPNDWDLEAMDRVFVTLLHAKDWNSITEENAPNHPPTAREYSEAGLPWFDYYGCDQTPLPGGKRLGSITSVGHLFQKKTGTKLPNCEDVETGVTKPVGPRQVSIGKW